MWWRIAPAAALGVDLRPHDHAALEAAVGHPDVVDVEPGERAAWCRVTSAAEPSEAITPWSPTWPPAIGVEGRAVEDDQALLAGVEARARARRRCRTARTRASSSARPS